MLSDIKQESKFLYAVIQCQNMSRVPSRNVIQSIKTITVNNKGREISLKGVPAPTWIKGDE